MVLDARGLDRGIPALLTWLQREGAIPAEAVPQILDAMGARGLTAEEAAIAIAGVDGADIARRYATHFHVPLVAEDAGPDADPSLAALLPAAFCRKHVMVPLSRTPA